MMTERTISIHAPREGGDDNWPKMLHDGFKISIHAPREGGDRSWRRSAPAHGHFNPRPPRGGRRPVWAISRNPSGFQSTPPARGATDPSALVSASVAISIHAPREGGDGRRWREPPTRRNFNPRPPRGGRLRGKESNLHLRVISIHAPREGGDSKDAQFYLRIFDKQVELLRFLGKIRGGCLRNPEKDRRFLGKSLANLPEISGHLDFAGGGKVRPGYPCAVPLPHRAACVRGSGDPPADRCSSYRNAPLFSHIASLDSKSEDCLSRNP